MSENICHLLGRLVKDPVLKYTQSGGAMAIMTLATDRKFISKSGKAITDFHKVIIWNKSAEIVAQTLHKGNRIFVTGSIENDNYIDNNGIKHYGYAIRAERFGYIDRKSESDTEQEQQMENPDITKTDEPDDTKPDISQGLPSMEDGAIIPF